MSDVHSEAQSAVPSSAGGCAAQVQRAAQAESQNRVGLSQKVQQEVSRAMAQGLGPIQEQLAHLLAAQSRPSTPRSNRGGASTPHTPTHNHRGESTSPRAAGANVQLGAGVSPTMAHSPRLPTPPTQQKAQGKDGPRDTNDDDTGLPELGHGASVRSAVQLIAHFGSRNADLWLAIVDRHWYTACGSFE